MAGILHGQSLSVFMPGTVYEIDEHLGVQLIALSGGVEDESTTRAVHLSTQFADELPGIDGGVRILRRERRKTKRRPARKTTR